MAWSPEQLAAANEFMQANIGNPGAIAARRDELGLNNNDLLQAAQTTNPNLGLSDVNSYFNPAQSGGPKLNTSYQQNPYLDQIAGGITQQANRNLQEQVLPGVRSNSIASGGFGGSRQGIAEGLAIGRNQDSINNSLASLYGNDYQQSQNRNLQQYLAEMGNATQNRGLDLQGRSIDNQYSLGLGGLNNQRYGIDQTYNLGMTNAANNRYGTDKSYEVGMAGVNASLANAQASQANAANNFALGQQQLGLNGLFGLLDRQYQYGQGGLNSANNIQNTPLSYWQQFGQGANALGQNGGSSMTSGTAATNPWAGALGGAQLANSWFNQQTPVASNNNVYFGTGSMGD